MSEITFARRVRVPELCLGNVCNSSWPSSSSGSGSSSTSFWASSGDDISRISGNVGIGIVNPSSKLDVDGDINVSGRVFQGGTPIIPVCQEGQTIVYSAGRLACGGISDFVAWSATEYSECSCDGEKTRAITCKRNSTEIVDDNECTGVKPESTTSCPAVTSCFAWDVPDFGTCDCSGNQSRSISCMNGTAIVSDSFCAEPKPDENQTCSTPGDCYEWLTSPYSACGCDGSQARSVLCKQGVTTVEDSLCPTPKPAETEACAASSNCYVWSTSAFDACSCSGSQTRTVVCKNGSNIVNDSLCTATKPSTTGTCAAPSSCYAWSTGTWDSCSCAGSQSRSVVCKNGSTTVSDALCVASKPAMNQSCSAPSTCYAWSTGSWSYCNCSSETQTRSVVCKDYQGTTVSSSLCTATQPRTSQSCTAPDSCYHAYCDVLMPRCYPEDLCMRSSVVVSMSECTSRGEYPPTNPNECRVDRDCDTVNR